MTSEGPAVAVAVVTCGLGVLLARRVDGNPPWVFPGGKVEPGETASAAAVREVAEETGLTVRATGLIGERVHPATARMMVYVAAEPVRDTVAAALDGSGLAEVRWVSAEEIDALTGGTLFEAAREHVIKHACCPEGLRET
jgi:8-oxo-dGTP diphosphatase